MTTLHMIASSAHSRSGMSDCLSLLGSDDAVVLIEEGVLALSQPGMDILQSLKTRLGSGDHLYFVRDHLVARGLSDDIAGWQAIDMDRLVDLHCEFDKSLTWY